MRIIPTTLLALLIAPTAFAQYDPKEGVVITNAPFNTQRPQGDGVPVATTQPAYIGQTGAIPPAMIPAPATTTTTTTTTAATPAAVAAPLGGMGLSKIFDEADTNHDNIVTRDEFIAKANVHFGMADTNKDNKITRPEMEAQQASVVQQMQKNLFGNGTLQNKINQVMGVGQAAPVYQAPVVVAPTAPVVAAPTTPAAPTVSHY